MQLMLILTIPIPSTANNAHDSQGLVVVVVDQWGKQENTGNLV